MSFVRSYDLFSETFGNDFNFNLSQTNCTSGFFESYGGGYPSVLRIDNNWVCSKNSSITPIHFSSTNDASYLNSILGLNSNNSISINNTFVSLRTFIPAPLYPISTDKLQFVCGESVRENATTYLNFYTNSSNVSNYRTAVTLSLDDGGCSNLPLATHNKYGLSSNCCELSAFAGGFDCGSFGINAKLTVNATFQLIMNACPSITMNNLSGINAIEYYTLFKNTTASLRSMNSYLDDLAISRNLTLSVLNPINLFFEDNFTRSNNDTLGNRWQELLPDSFFNASIDSNTMLIKHRGTSSLSSGVNLNFTDFSLLTNETIAVSMDFNETTDNQYGGFSFFFTNGNGHPANGLSDTDVFEMVARTDLNAFTYHKVGCTFFPDECLVANYLRNKPYHIVFYDINNTNYHLKIQINGINYTNNGTGFPYLTSLPANNFFFEYGSPTFGNVTIDNFYAGRNINSTFVAPPPTISNTPYYEDFEDLNITSEQTLVSNSTCLYPLGTKYIGSVENPNITTSCPLQYIPPERFINISRTSGYNSTYSVMVTASNNSNTTAGIVGLFSVELNSSFIINSTTAISFYVNTSDSGLDSLQHLRVDLLDENDNIMYSFEHGSGISLFTPNVWQQVFLQPVTPVTFKKITFYKTFSKSTSPMYFKLDNLYIPVTENVPSISNLPAITYFNETFKNRKFLYETPTNCTTACYSALGCFFGLQNLSLDNNWYCWKGFNDVLGIPSYTRYSNISDTGKIDTANGLNVYTTTSFATYPVQNYLVSFFNPITLEDNDTISWTCDMPSQTIGNDIYLSMGNNVNETVLLGMGTDVGTRCGYEGLPTTHCCDLNKIVGVNNDCKNSAKTKVSITKKQIVTNCTNINDADFINLNHIGLWTTSYVLFSSQEYYFDDLSIAQRQGQISGNSQPIITSVIASPNPANVSQNVSWNVLIMDDDLPANIYTGFDCNNDNVLEYPVTINGDRQFNCSYATTGTYTAKAYVSDTTYYPILNSGTGQVEVREIGSDRGGNCDGFLAPTCEGSCIFFDNFNYDNYPITCNNWIGSDKHPTNNMLVMDNLLSTDARIDNGFTTINNWENSAFSFSFDIIVNSPDKITFGLFAPSGTYNQLNYLYWDNYVLYSLDSVTPYVTRIMNFTKGDRYNFYGLVNFTTTPKKITYIIYDSLGANTTTQVENFDDVNSVSKLSFYIDAPVVTNFTIDNLLVTKGSTNTNGTAPITSQNNYVYDGNMFCAINWSSAKPKFSPDNCALRGYDQPALLGLCPVRACIADTGSFLFQSALNNIFMTILILIVIIIFAPILVLLVKRR